MLPALERLVEDETWDTASSSHTAVNWAVSYALTGERMFLGRFGQAPGCLNVLDVRDEWVVRAVNVAPRILSTAPRASRRWSSTGCSTDPTSLAE